jgi:hypothetical protein
MEKKFRLGDYIYSRKEKNSKLRIITYIGKTFHRLLFVEGKNDGFSYTAKNIDNFEIAGNIFEVKKNV